MKDIELPAKNANGNNYIIRKGIMSYHHHMLLVDVRKFGEVMYYSLNLKDGRKGINTYDQYTFTAFNINPRMCLGKQFAMTEAKVWMYNFLRNFEFEACKDKKVTIRTGAILNMDTGFYIKLSQRNCGHEC